MEDTRELGTILAENYEHLPAPLQELVRSPEIDRKVAEVGARYRLHIDDIGKLDDETRLVLLGITNPRDFERKVAAALEADTSTAGKIVRDIDAQILKPLRAELMKVYADDDTREGRGSGEPRTPAQEKIENRDEIIREIETPWRISFRTEPIQPILPKEEKAVETKAPEPGPPEKVTPETLAELPPALRPQATPPTPPEPAPRPPLPPSASDYEPVAAQKTVSPPPNLPTKETIQDAVNLTRREPEVIDENGGKSAEEKRKNDPYRESIA